MINKKTTKNNSNVVIKLYRNYSLLSTKTLLLKVYKNRRNFSDWIDADLPQPTLIAEAYDGYFIGWAINGKIKTKEQKNFYKDLSLRLKKTLLKRTDLQRVENSSVWALQYALEGGERFITKQSYEMKKLASFCESLTSKEEKEKKLADTTTREELHIYAGTYEKSEDALFDFIRHKVYDYKRIAMIEKREVSLEELDNYAKAIADIGYEVIGGKGISTAKAKAKNIAEWTFYNYGNGKRKRKTKTEEELKMTRIERSKANAKLKYDRVHKKILNIITGMFADEYKKKDNSWNISKIAKEANVTRASVYKHLKDEGLI